MKKNEQSKGFFKRTYNFRAWIDVDRNSQAVGGIKELLKKLFIPRSSQVNESIDNAMARFGLSEEELNLKKRSLLRLAWLALIAAILIGVYAVYHLIHAQYLAFIESSVLMLVSLGFAFKYHFWFFQIKRHKLGCSVKEWFKYGLLGMKQ